MNRNWNEYVLMICCAVTVSAEYSPNTHSIYCPSYHEGYCQTTGVCCNANDRCSESRHYGDDGCVDEWTVASIWWMFMCIGFIICTCAAVAYYCRRRRYIVSTGPGGVPVVVNDSGDVQMVQVVQAQPAYINQQYPPVIAPTGHTLYPNFLPDGRPIYPVDITTGIPCIPAGVIPGPDGQPLWPPVPTGIIVDPARGQLYPHPPPPLSAPPLPPPPPLQQQHPTAPTEVIMCQSAPFPPPQQNPRI